MTFSIAAQSQMPGWMAGPCTRAHIAMLDRCVQSTRLHSIMGGGELQVGIPLLSIARAFRRKVRERKDRAAYLCWDRQARQILRVAPGCDIDSLDIIGYYSADADGGVPSAAEIAEDIEAFFESMGGGQ